VRFIYGKSLAVGTPPQNFTVVFDTGSFSFEIPSVQCGSACALQKQFNPSKSSTFLDYHSSTTESFGTGVGVDPQGDWEPTLARVRDTVTLTGIEAAKTQLYLITDQTALFAPDPFDGIQQRNFQHVDKTGSGSYVTVFKIAAPDLLTDVDFLPLFSV
jgi:hypothetical protein